MTPHKYRQMIAALGLTQEAAGEYFRLSKKTGQRWAKDGPPLEIAMLLIAVGRKRPMLDDLRYKAETFGDDD